MITLIIFLPPICIVGMLIYKLVTRSERFELMLPVGSIIGLSCFTFLLNSIAFVFKGNIGVIVSYILLILIGVLCFFNQRKDFKFSLNFLQGKLAIYWLISLLGWGYFIYWKTKYALIGSDTNLYYAIAHSFLRGNFPPMTPWQPDIPLSYHLGAFELLGAFFYFTGLKFQFLHLFFSSFFIICSIQIIIWIWERHTKIWSFILANVSVFITFVSFGFLYLVFPNSSISLPNIKNINELVVYLRELPTVNQSIEVYGASVNLDSLIYFIFHVFGISIFLSLICILIDYKKKNPLLSWIVICICLSTLALVNESIFVAAAPALFLGILLIEKGIGTLRKNIGKLVVLLFITSLTILFQGGIITSSILSSGDIEKSVVFFPKKENIKENFVSYHYYQEVSKFITTGENWLSLRWFHVGVELLFLVGILLLIIQRLEQRHFVLSFVLLSSSVISLIAYNNIVPKYIIANGNRFLAFSYMFFSLLICLSLIRIINLKKGKFWVRIFLIFMLFWIFVPTIIPPLALLSKTRFGENLLSPKLQQDNEGVEWIKQNINYDSRVMILDSNAPHPSGVARALIGAGVFAPIFPSKFKAYTIETSPEYLDVAYYLSPRALKELKIEVLLIDSNFYQTLPELRRQQLDSNSYFKILFEKKHSEKNWEKVMRIEPTYFENGTELQGSIVEMTENIGEGRIYIDNEEGFDPSYLRRPIIFSLRGRDLYYLPQSGIYLNVEQGINSNLPTKEGIYDYLILGSNTKMEEVCNCSASLIWMGLREKVNIWKRDKN